MLGECCNSNCDVKSIVLYSTDISGNLPDVTTIYTGNGTLLSDRTVTANNNDLSFNMGTGTFLVTGALNNSGVITTTGVTLVQQVALPGGSGTLWISGGELFLGNINYADLPIAVTGCFTGNGQRATPLQIELDPTGLIACGANGLRFTGNSFECSDLNSCSVGEFYNMSTYGDPDGTVFFYNSPSGYWEPTHIETASGISYAIDWTPGWSSLTFFPVLYPSGQLSIVTFSNPGSAFVQTGFAFSGIIAGDCLDGNGTYANPLEITLDPTGLITCGPSGLRYTGPLGDNLGNHTATQYLDMNFNEIYNPTLIQFNSPVHWKIQPGIGDFFGYLPNETSLSFQSSNDDIYVLSLMESGRVLLYNEPHQDNTENRLLVWNDGFIDYRDASTIFNSVAVSGCIQGAGISGNPLSIELDPEGLLECGPSGLKYSGPIFSCSTLNSCSIDSLSDVSVVSATSGNVLIYNGVNWVPGNVATSGESSGDCVTAYSYESGLAPPAPSTPSTPSPDASIQIEVFDNQINFWSNDTGWVLDKTFTGGSGGSTAPSNDAGNLITLGSDSGIYLSSSTICSNLSNCSINQLGDVYTVGATSGEILVWDNTNWTRRSQYFNVSDGTTTLQINNQDTITLLDTANINFVTSSGSGQKRIAATVVISPDSGNILGNGPYTNGLYAYETPLVVTTDSTTTGVTQSGSANHNVNIVLRHPHHSNRLQINATTGGLELNGDQLCSGLGGATANCLLDVTYSVPASGQVLTWDGVQWTNRTISMTGVLGGGGAVSSFSLFAPFVHRHDNGSGVVYDIDIRDGISTSGGNDLLLDNSGLPYFSESISTLTHSEGTLTYTNETGLVSNFDICNILQYCSLSQLGDVADSVATNNQILRWNTSSGRWIPSNENIAGSYSFNITDGTNTETIGTGQTVTFADSDCIDFAVSSTDTVSAEVLIAGTQELDELDNPGNPEFFANSLVCLPGQGLFVPCVEVLEPTVSTGTDRLILRLPCGGTNWTQVQIPYFEDVLRAPLQTAEVVDGDPAIVGTDILIHQSTGELFYNDSANWKKLPGTYGWYTTTTFTGGVAKTLTHDLSNDYLVVQVYQQSGTGTWILYNTPVIELLTSDSVRITIPSIVGSNTFKVMILPVLPLT